MTETIAKTGDKIQTSEIGFFEKWLTVWVFLCIVAGVIFGQVLPGLFKTIGAMEIARVNIPVGVLIWVMIIPMLLKIDFKAIDQVKQHWRGMGVTLISNVGLKPNLLAQPAVSLSDGRIPIYQLVAEIIVIS